MNTLKMIEQIDKLAAKQCPKASQTWAHVCAYDKHFATEVYSYEIDYYGNEKIAARLVKESHDRMTFQKKVIKKVNVPIDFDFASWKYYVERNYKYRDFYWLKGVA